MGFQGPIFGSDWVTTSVSLSAAPLHIIRHPNVPWVSENSFVSALVPTGLMVPATDQRILA